MYNIGYARVSISIHALHEESDRHLAVHSSGVEISIHALHEESDLQYRTPPKANYYFNPRSP